MFQKPLVFLVSIQIFTPFFHQFYNAFCDFRDVWDKLPVVVEHAHHLLHFMYICRGASSIIAAVFLSWALFLLQTGDDLDSASVF